MAYRYRFTLDEGFTVNPRTAFAWYFVAVAVLVSGIVCGALALNVLESNEREELLSFLSLYLRDIQASPDQLTSSQVMAAALASNFKTGLAVCAMGATVALAPFALAILFVKGFLVGFAVGLMVNEMGSRGMLLAVAAVFPHNAILLPGCVLAVVGALSFAWHIVFGRRVETSLWSEAARYFRLQVFLALVWLAASALESHASFPLMKLFSRML